MGTCFHCGLPAEKQFSAEIDGVNHAFCCFGCQAITYAISESGLSAFYQFRDKQNKKPSQVNPKFSHYDLEEVQGQIANQLVSDQFDIILSIAGISCAACAWLIEHRVEKIPGVTKVGVNATNALCHIEWDRSECRLSDIFSAIAEVGYDASPHAESQQQHERIALRKSMLMRLGMAGIGMMQVGMFAIALHAGALQDMENDWQHFFRWISLLVATPVVFYSARPFFSNAINSLKNRRLGMDVPVALAIGLSYVASLWATLSNEGEVYFDSISMFTFFLLLGRFLEMKVRHSCAFVAESFSQLLPLAVTRIPELKTDQCSENNAEKSELIPLSALRKGDMISVAAGEAIPCDGEVCDGEGTVNEMLLSGESEPQLKAMSTAVWAGSIVGESPLKIRVRATGKDTKLASIERLVHRAMSEKPCKVVRADKVASVFVLCVLIVAAFSAGVWYYIAPEKSLWVALSVLVVTCPCALSLATPTALTAGALRLRKMGVLVTSSFFIEKLVDITHIVFDKTGTLTEGKLSVAKVDIIDRDASESHDAVLSIIAALETDSNHPIAHAFSANSSQLIAEKLKAIPGQGIQGVIDQKLYRFGIAPFASPSLALAYPGPGLWQLLSCEQKPVAWVLLQDQPRSDVVLCMETLSSQDISCEMMSGDRNENVTAFAQRHNIQSYIAEALPETKLAHIKSLQSSGESVLMVGDGINDVPGLSGASVSLAMGDSTRLAQTNADAILLSGKLSTIPAAIRFSHRVQDIIRQNFYWALGYNIVALPAAVAGIVPPYIAAVGMSFSSLVVVMNALRLNRTKQENAGSVFSLPSISTSVLPSISR